MCGARCTQMYSSENRIASQKQMFSIYISRDLARSRITKCIISQAPHRKWTARETSLANLPGAHCFARLRAARCVQGHSRNASSGARSRDGGIGDSTQLVQHVGGQVQHDSNADGSGAVQRRDAKVAAEP